MEIKYIKQLKNIEQIEMFFEEKQGSIPKGFKTFFEINNGGRPVQNICILANGSEKVVNNFLSFNEEDKENVYKARKRIEEDDSQLIPFAMDPAGNYYCIKKEKIVFYFHEDGQQIEAAASFEEFLKNLK